MQPLVSIICLCYNHEPFVLEALQTVVYQSYTNWELIIVDDASQDASKNTIRTFVEKTHVKQRIVFIDLPQNKGNCTAFNIGFAQSKGKYIIDLAADDRLHSQRLARQVYLLERASLDTGVCFSNANLIDEKGVFMGLYYPDWYKGEVKEGFIFSELVRAGGMICSPTMLIKREVIEQLNGYDEQLSYEDYDFWVRSSKDWKYIFSPESLTEYRQVASGHHHSFKKRKNSHLDSTFVVCQKAFDLCQTPKEYQSLLQSVMYHGKESLRYYQFPTAIKFASLALKTVFKI